ncbi:PREDICTED: upstream stimulatory factor 2-like [Cyprinodon variegatus]|uniref:upstream stimulatory factor 2-like n=1 Tax=Cyprinodon variegatus TaxID=28743 RepID=UPI000742CB9B|nr:PREDICTED: upstream stimulatory factor 2-like [Cyprinodon variegatus]
MEMLDQSLEGSVSHAKQETAEVVQLQEGEAVGTDEQSAVTITSVPQAAFADHGVQYQFRTENNGGQVERRRRDKINNWIVTLSKLIPDCSQDTRTGASKGGILSKACDYIRELRQNNQRLQESYKELERVEMDNELLRQQIEELKNENALLRAQLQQHGVEVGGDETPQ